jgi:hypothetical protein
MTQFLSSEVQPDWRERDLAIQAQYDRQWQALLPVIVVCSLGLLAGSLLLPAQFPGWIPLLATLIYSILLGSVLWIIFPAIRPKPTTSAVRTLWPVVLLSLLGGSGIVLSAPAPAYVSVANSAGGGWIGLLLLTPAAALGLWWFSRRALALAAPILGLEHPLPLRRNVVDLLYGLLVGAGLGLQFTLAAHLAGVTMPEPDVLRIFWLLGVLAFYVVPIQEFVQRGLVYHIFYTGKQQGLLPTALVSAACDAALGCLPLLGHSSWIALATWIFYRFAFGFAAVYLRFRSGNLWSAYIANLLASTLILATLG